MHVSIATCCLASVVATFVVVTTSLPQSASSPPDGILSSRQIPITYGNDLFYYQTPKDYFGIGATNYEHDVEGRLGKWDSQSPGTHAGASDLARRGDPIFICEPPLACGIIVANGQSDTFGFPNIQKYRLLWNLGGAEYRGRLVKIMEVVPQGRDIVVLSALARYFSYSGFKPAANKLCYIRLSGRGQIRLTWFFDYLYARALFCSSVLTYQAKQRQKMTGPQVSRTEQDDTRIQVYGLEKNLVGSRAVLDCDFLAIQFTDEGCSRASIPQTLCPAAST